MNLILYRVFRRAAWMVAGCLSIGLAIGPSVGRADDNANVAKETTKDTEFSREQVAHFEKKVQPLLEKHCYACHAGGKRKGGLRLDYRGGLVAGGDSGPAIDLESPGDSLLLTAINYDGFEMPPKGKLPAEAIDVLTKWVRNKSPWRAGGDKPPGGEHKETKPPQVNAETKAFWSFQRVKKPQPPQLGPEIKNPIDAFILEKLKAAGLEPAPEANKHTLIRRLSYDLTGLPPTPKEVEAFVADTSDEAYERLVDRLLASPRYGERWARHWLDLVRYAETNSYERDGAKPFVWRYRDYVIRSFNDDKPYNQFIREQLAGDELDQPSDDAIIATGYYRLGIWDDEPVDQLQANFDDLDDVLSTTGQVFLGLTIGCARCHDHKLDPIPQSDYYSMLSFFGNIRRYGVRGHNTVLDASVRMVGTDDAKKRYQADLTAWRAELKKTEDALRTIEKEVRPKLKGGVRDDFKRERVRLRIMQDLKGDVVSADQFEQYKTLFEKRDKLRRSEPAGLMQVLAVSEHGVQPKPIHVLVRGNAHAKGKQVEPAFPAVLGFPAPEFPANSPFPNSSGRRRVLADWIASPDNPLTARVMANRIWQYHFGQGIVESSSDFGLTGRKPTHPELLDWLAATLVEGGWRMKPLHKRILMSKTYRMGHVTNDKAQSIDPNNKLLWSFRLRRLTAEEIRDSILAVSGELRDKMFGPSIYSKIPAEVLAGQSRPGAGWGNSPPNERFRRSIYIHVKRSLVTPLLSSFDFPEPDLTCPVRFVSTQPTQALGMLNSDFSGELSTMWAGRLMREHKDDLASQINVVLRRVTQRQPTAKEIQIAKQLVATLESEHKLPREKSLQQLCLMALNLNEFLYLD